ncbi:MAG: YbaB/EbfC family nucleoid-associated protein [Marmoricola sp.]
MTENPTGPEGFDLGAMLEQAQQMQQQLMQAQSELADTSVTGTSGGVSVTLNGTGELTAVTFATGSTGADDEESRTDLGDLVVAAYRDAKAKADAVAADKLGPLAGGLGGGQEPGGLGGLLGGPGV